MEQRVLGRTGRPVSVVGLGTWQLGADWGNVSEDEAMKVLRTAAESGVTFFDTADVYGDGRSERIIGRFLAGNAGQGVMVATKMGRRVEQKPENYTMDNFRAWTDRSRVNLGTDRVGRAAGADAAAEFARMAGGLPGDGTTAQWAPSQWALRWVIQQAGVTTVIPGARSTSQAEQNAEAASLPPLPQASLDAIEGLYDRYFRATVHDRW